MKLSNNSNIYNKRVNVPAYVSVSVTVNVTGCVTVNISVSVTVNVTVSVSGSVSVTVSFSGNVSVTVNDSVSAMVTFSVTVIVSVNVTVVSLSASVSQVDCSSGVTLVLRWCSTCSLSINDFPYHELKSGSLAGDSQFIGLNDMYRLLQQVGGCK